MGAAQEVLMGATRTGLTEEQGCELADGIAGSPLAYDGWKPAHQRMEEV